MQRTEEAKTKYKIAELEERINLAIAEYKMKMEKETLYRILSKIEGLESIKPDNEVQGPPYTLMIEGYEFLVKEDLTVQYIKKSNNSSILPEINSIRKIEITEKQVTLEIDAETKDSEGLKEIRIIKNGIEIDKIENLNGNKITQTYNITGNGIYKITVIGKNGKQVTSEEMEITELKTTTGTIQEGTNINGQILLTIKASSEERIKKVYVYDNTKNLIANLECDNTEIEEEARVEIPFYEEKVYYAEIETDYEKVSTNNVRVTNEEFIKTETDLIKFANLVNNGTNFAEKKSIKQVADIILTQNHIVIGTTEIPFNGSYDGQGYSIKNLKVNGTTGHDYGVFGYVQGTNTKFAEVNNLVVEGDITGTYNVGGIVGRINCANVKGCINKASVTSTSGDTTVYGYSSTGGIVGRIGENGSNIENCKNYGIISGNKECIGGIVGLVRNGNVMNCENNVDITSNNHRTGGIVGGGPVNNENPNYNVYISKCINNGNISGPYIIGGIIGASASIKIDECINNGNITTNQYTEDNGINISPTGGIIGRVIIIENNANSINKCINNGSIKGKYARVGGITGEMHKGKIENCINNNSIEGTVFVAGICGDAGYVSGDIVTSVAISKCKNTKLVKGEYEVGGIAGRLRGGGTIEQSCNIGDITSTKYNSENYSYTGGIAGVAGGGNNILYCYNTGNIEAQTRGIGGITSYASSNKKTVLNYCYNTGNITNNGTQYAGKTGGIIGLKHHDCILTVTNCWQLKDCIKKGTDNEQLSVTTKTENEIKALNWSNFTVNSDKNNGYPILNWEDN